VVVGGAKFDPVVVGGGTEASCSRPFSGRN
jgi:hypothetical protein